MKFLLLAAFVASTCTPAKPAPPPDPTPIVDAGFPTDAKAPVTGCLAALENSKRLGCTFEGDDASWCAAHTAAQVSCVAKAANCLATRQQCLEASK